MEKHQPKAMTTTTINSNRWKNCKTLKMKHIVFTTNTGEHMKTDTHTHNIHNRPYTRTKHTYTRALENRYKCCCSRSDNTSGSLLLKMRRARSFFRDPHAHTHPQTHSHIQNWTAIFAVLWLFYSNGLLVYKCSNFIFILPAAFSLSSVWVSVSLLWLVQKGVLLHL